jgi:hypothetical protein
MPPDHDSRFFNVWMIALVALFAFALVMSFWL